MAVQTDYPGVYVEELRSGTRSITGVATSVTAFIGRTARGDVTRPIRCFSFADFERNCGGLWAKSELGHAVLQYFQNGGSDAIVSRVITGAASTPSNATTGTFRFDAASPGAWGDNLRAGISFGTPGGFDAAASGEFHLAVFEIDPATSAAVVREEFFHVSVDTASPRYLGRILEQESKLARLGAAPATGVPAATPVGAPLVFGGGSDGVDGTTTEYEAAIARLELADLVNLVAVPPPGPDSDTSLAVLASAAAWCERRRAILLVDPPHAWRSFAEAADLVGGYASLRARNVAFYYPAIEAPDRLQQGRPRRFAPSGAIAGVIARIDGERGVWKAPAGIEAGLVGVTRVDPALTDGENGVVNARGVNALRAHAVGGPVVWGARTAVGADDLASEWKYLPVRRLALYIEESLQRGTRWAVFEPNAEPLWAELRRSVGAFMQQLFRRDAFKGARASDAYFVSCDASTTTQDDIDRGVVNLLVGFAPLKPAEFVVLKFQQLAGQGGMQS